MPKNFSTISTQTLLDTTEVLTNNNTTPNAFAKSTASEFNIYTQKKLAAVSSTTNIDNFNLLGQVVGETSLKRLATSVLYNKILELAGASEKHKIIVGDNGNYATLYEAVGYINAQSDDYYIISIDTDQQITNTIKIQKNIIIEGNNRLLEPQNSLIGDEIFRVEKSLILKNVRVGNSNGWGVSANDVVCYVPPAIDIINIISIENSRIDNAYYLIDGGTTITNIYLKENIFLNIQSGISINYSNLTSYGNYWGLGALCIEIIGNTKIFLDTFEECNTVCDFSTYLSSETKQISIYNCIWDGKGVFAEPQYNDYHVDIENVTNFIDFTPFGKITRYTSPTTSIPIDTTPIILDIDVYDKIVKNRIEAYIDTENTYRIENLSTITYRANISLQLIGQVSDADIDIYFEIRKNGGSTLAKIKKRLLEKVGETFSISCIDTINENDYYQIYVYSSYSTLLDIQEITFSIHRI